MSWSFRKRVKIIPGLHLNFSKNGISTSIGGRGGSVTFSKRGTSFNASIPGSGFSNRVFIPDQKPKYDYLPSKPLHVLPDQENLSEADIKGNIFSVDIHEITTADKQGIKEAILLARTQRAELAKDLKDIQSSLSSSKRNLLFSKIFLYGFAFKKFKENIEINISSKLEAISETKKQMQSSYVMLDADFDAEVKSKYVQLIEAFKALRASIKMWDITNSEYNDRVTTRSLHSASISRTEIDLNIKSIPDIKSDLDVMWIQNANGADIYIYPSFIVMCSQSGEIGIIGIEEFIIKAQFTRFVEQDPVPKDARILEYTWFKVNKNGSPDLRFKNNYQIPIVEYTNLSLSSKTGMNEEYEFSNKQLTVAFYNAFLDYQELLAINEGNS
ncbi:DUF4236 domain-containing protein [Dyadobacter sp. NIV53]|uniref:DUF4236 domain-containing protein n=1 Tax=Dyadobacter sp. NIV53 TaxID=2861765 RepID=UPI001C86E7C0|nr:DUF4236 domain-containing protein [Dyadobacter sp. NIV53]